MIGSLCGELPNGGYILLVKKLQYTNTSTDTVIYLNLAFELDSKEEFRKLCRGFCSGDQSERLADCVITDSHAEIGAMKFDRAKFDAWLQTVLNGGSGKYDTRCDDALVLKTTSGDDLTEDIRDCLKLPFVRTGNDTYIYSKKKSPKPVRAKEGSRKPKAGKKPAAGIPLPAKILLCIAGAALLLGVIVLIADLIKKVLLILF